MREVGWWGELRWGCVRGGGACMWGKFMLVLHIPTVLLTVLLKNNNI